MILLRIEYFIIIKGIKYFIIIQGSRGHQLVLNINQFTRTGTTYAINNRNTIVLYSAEPTRKGWVPNKKYRGS